MSTNFARGISTRLVIEYELVPRSKGKTDFWVVDDNLIETVDGVEFVTMSTACRGMAKAIGADMSLSVPLGQYVYTDTLRELRNGAVTKLMGELEKERNPAYVEGKTKPIRTSMEDELPKVIDVTLPPIGHGGETYGPLDIKMRLQVKSNKAVAVAMTKPFFDYFVAAMHAAKQPDDGATPRKRCKRNERVSETTGVSGVRMYGSSHGSKAEPRIGVPYTDDDGIKKYKTVVLRDGAEMASAAAKLKGQVCDLTSATDHEAEPTREACLSADARHETEVAADDATKEEQKDTDDVGPVCDVGASSGSADWSRIFPSLG